MEYNPTVAEFGEWLSTQLKERGWNQAELARRASVTDATLSRIISGTRQLGPDVATSIARALQIPPDFVFREAGLLPSLPPAVEEEREVVSILRSLPARIRALALATLRAMAQAEGLPVYESHVPYNTEQDASIRELVAEFRLVPDDWKEEAIRQVQFIARMATRTPAHIIGGEDMADHEDMENRDLDSGQQRTASLG